ncbi:MAG: nucleotide exchange factor GrpE [Cyanobacteria bacterium P01_E01_bin.6]
MVDQKKVVEDVQVDANQDISSNPEDISQSSDADNDVTNNESVQEQVEQSAEAPTWADAEIEEVDDEEVEVIDVPSSREPSLESEASQAIFESLKQENATLKSQVDDRTAQYVRIAADFENFRKRTQKDREELEQTIKCTTITELLPVVDNFERARSQIKPQTDGEMNIHKSYQSVYKQLVDGLKRLGVSPMRAEGSPFDPNLHEAVMREPTSDHPEGTVMEELMRGYMLGERVIRHAMVKVAAEAEPEADSGQSSDADGEA